MVCQLCQAHHAAEDLLHFMLECPAYSDIRVRYPELFSVRFRSVTRRIQHIFTYEQQHQTVRCCWDMHVRRCSRLGLSVYGGATQQPVAAMAAQPLECMQSHTSLCLTVAVLILVVLLAVGMFVAR